VVFVKGVKIKQLSMPAFREKYGPWAIVVGSAEGLGEAYSKALARRKVNLVMVDRKADLMIEVATSLGKEYGIQTLTMELDLSEKDAAQTIMEKAREVDARMLLYIAAFSNIKPFLSYSTEELDAYQAVNMRTKIGLTQVFAQKLIEEKKGGGILFMSSLSGLIGMQLIAPYAATKAYAWNLAESLHYELKPNGIDMMACVAGATSTPAYNKTTPKYGAFKPRVMEPDAVAELALKNFGKKALYIPGFSNRMNYFFLTRLLPRNMAGKLANRMMGKMYAHYRSR
jgi:short-subunit dehydrogenase